MSFLLRTVTRGRWFKKPSTFPWLSENDIHADPVTDLRTSDNTLSVFKVDEDKGNLRRVAIALAATREHTDVLDYMLFEERLVADLRIKLELLEGDTPDKVVNSRHVQLVELSAAKLGASARAVLETTAPGRFQEPEVKQSLHENIKTGVLDTGKMKRKLLSQLGYTT